MPHRLSPSAMLRFGCSKLHCFQRLTLKVSAPAGPRILVVEQRSKVKGQELWDQVFRIGVPVISRQSFGFLLQFLLGLEIFHRLIPILSSIIFMARRFVKSPQYSSMVFILGLRGFWSINLLISHRIWSFSLVHLPWIELISSTPLSLGL